jgi:formylglycine-generating enzyme required for sulfatase activity
MSGNVWEWCWDWYGNYSKKTEIDYLGPDSGSYRVMRGDAWNSDADYCRITFRGNNYPEYRGFIVGFRLARSI